MVDDRCAWRAPDGGVPGRWSRTRRVLIGGGQARPYDSDEWADALVLVETGTIELVHPVSGRWPFATGAILTLADMGLVSIANPGTEAAGLLLLSRPARRHHATHGAAIGGRAHPPGAVRHAPARGIVARADHVNVTENPHEGETEMQMKLELVPIPVTDVDRAKAFYTQSLGFCEDVDVEPAEGIRVVQLTPPGSACSIGMGTGLPAYDDMTPGAVQGLHLVVADIDSACADLRDRGIDVGVVVDVGGGVKHAALSDPDGNTFTMQEMPWRTGDSY